jgi:hypothetical protein
MTKAWRDILPAPASERFPDLSCRRTSMGLDEGFRRFSQEISSAGSRDRARTVLEAYAEFFSRLSERGRELILSAAQNYIAGLPED